MYSHRHTSVITTSPGTSYFKVRTARCTTPFSAYAPLARSSFTAGMPNKIAVRGHTDSLAFDDGVRSNWSLSGDRAESTRRIMEGAGIPSNRFSKIEGVADREAYYPDNPLDPRNRRTRPVGLAPVGEHRDEPHVVEVRCVAVREVLLVDDVVGDDVVGSA